MYPDGIYFLNVFLMPQTISHAEQHIQIYFLDIWESLCVCVCLCPCCVDVSGVKHKQYSELYPLLIVISPEEMPRF